MYLGSGGSVVAAQPELIREKARDVQGQIEVENGDIVVVRSFEVELDLGLKSHGFGFCASERYSYVRLAADPSRSLHRASDLSRIATRRPRSTARILQTQRADSATARMATRSRSAHETARRHTILVQVRFVFCRAGLVYRQHSHLGEGGRDDYADAAYASFDVMARCDPSCLTSCYNALMR